MHDPTKYHIAESLQSKLFEYDYDLNKFEKDVNLVKEALNRVYKEIVKFYSWEE